MLKNKNALAEKPARAFFIEQLKTVII